jgi:hypothetical protein
MLIHKIPAIGLSLANPKKPVDYPIDLGLAGVKFSLIFLEKQMIAGVQKKKAEQVKNPMKTVYQFDSHCNENDAENNCQKNTNQQSTTCISFLDPEISEDQDENKNIIDAQRPFHEVSRKKFGGHHRRFFEP